MINELLVSQILESAVSHGDIYTLARIYLRFNGEYRQRLFFKMASRFVERYRKYCKEEGEFELDEVNQETVEEFAKQLMDYYINLQKKSE